MLLTPNEAPPASEQTLAAIDAKIKKERGLDDDALITPPIYDSIDPAVFDVLDESDADQWVVQFSMNDCRVRVSDAPDGPEVEVTPVEVIDHPSSPVI